MEGRIAESIEHCLQTIRLGRATERGGLAIHALLGWSAERHGLSSLAELRSSLADQQRRELIEVLESLDTGRESMEDFAFREVLWGKRTFGWMGRLEMLLSSKSRKGESWRPACEGAEKRRQATWDLLITDLAIRCYEADHGELPSELADLVPEFLAEVPEDPFSGKPLVYRPDPTGYLLYSVGHDETDDGGVPESLGGGDILLAEPEEEPDPIDDESLWE